MRGGVKGLDDLPNVLKRDIGDNLGVSSLESFSSTNTVNRQIMEDELKLRNEFATGHRNLILEKYNDTMNLVSQAQSITIHGWEPTVMMTPSHIFRFAQSVPLLSTVPEIPNALDNASALLDEIEQIEAIGLEYPLLNRQQVDTLRDAVGSLQPKVDYIMNANEIVRKEREAFDRRVERAQRQRDLRELQRQQRERICRGWLGQLW